ncbi:MAG: thiosulfate oxidation carrier protein SoxY [Alphaproteobacteria bacterium]
MTDAMLTNIDTDRRTFFRLLGGGVATVTLMKIAPLAAQEGAPMVDIPGSIRPILVDAFGGADLRPGRVDFEIPLIAETGLSVPVSFDVESSMTDADHVRRIMAFVPGNPEPIAADYLLGPRAGLAKVSSRIRIARSQIVIAAALMSDGSRYGASASIQVTRGACLDDIFLPDLRAVEERERARDAE